LLACADTGKRRAALNKQKKRAQSRLNKQKKRAQSRLNKQKKKSAEPLKGKALSLSSLAYLF
jgi:F0F1-type ATP synthase membrane subunit b/b'